MINTWGRDSGASDIWSSEDFCRSELCVKEKDCLHLPFSCHFMSFVRVIMKMDLSEIIKDSYKSLQGGNTWTCN